MCSSFPALLPGQLSELFSLDALGENPGNQRQKSYGEMDTIESFIIHFTKWTLYF